MMQTRAVPDPRWPGPGIAESRCPTKRDSHCQNRGPAYQIAIRPVSQSDFTAGFRSIVGADEAAFDDVGILVFRALHEDRLPRFEQQTMTALDERFPGLSIENGKQAELAQPAAHTCQLPVGRHVHGFPALSASARPNGAHSAIIVLNLHTLVAVQAGRANRPTL